MHVMAIIEIFPPCLLGLHVLIEFLIGFFVMEFPNGIC